MKFFKPSNIAGRLRNSRRTTKVQRRAKTSRRELLSFNWQATELEQRLLFAADLAALPTAVTGEFVGSDNFLDTAQINGNQVEILQGSATGPISLPVQRLNVSGWQPVGIMKGDFNDDGRFDLAVISDGVGSDDRIDLFFGTGNIVTPFAHSDASSFAIKDGLTDLKSLVMGDFNGDHLTDFAVLGGDIDGTNGVAFPLTPVQPISSLIQSGSVHGAIGLGGDADAYTVHLEADQTLSVLVTPSDTLKPIITITPPSSATFTINSGDVYGPFAAGTYKITVSGGVSPGGADPSSGTFDLEVAVNSALEQGTSRQINGQNIEGSFRDLENGGDAKRGAVLGTADGSANPDYYSFNLIQGESVSMTLNEQGLSHATFQLQLLGPGLSDPLAIGQQKGDYVVTEFIAQQSGVYRARITGDAGVDYSLLVFKNASFETEPDDTRSQAQDVSLTGGVFGYLEPGATVFSNPIGDSAEGAEPNDGLASASVLKFKSIVGGQYQTSLNGILSIGTDRDYYKFTAAPGDAVQIALNGNTNGNTLRDSYLYLYDKNGSLIASNDDGGGNLNSLLNFSGFTYTGDYYIAAASYQGGYAGTYNLAVTFTPSTPHDYYKVSANAGDKLDIKIGSGFVTEVYDPNGTRVNRDSVDNTWHANTRGSYSVLVYAEQNSAGGAYVLNVSGATGNQLISLAQVEPFDSQIQVYEGTTHGIVGAGQDKVEHRFVDLASGQRLSIVVDVDSDLRARFEIRDPSGNRLEGSLFQADEAGENFLLQDLVISDSGTYDLVFSDLDGDGGVFDAELLVNSLAEEPVTTVQKLDTHFIPSGVGDAAQAAVVGTFDVASHFEKTVTRFDTFVPGNAVVFSFSSAAAPLPIPVGQGTLKISAVGNLAGATLKIGSRDFILRDGEIDTANISGAKIWTVELDPRTLADIVAGALVSLNAGTGTNTGLNGVMMTLGYERAVEVSDTYSFTLEAGRTASLALAGVTGTTSRLWLTDSAGNYLAAGADFGGQLRIANFRNTADVAQTFVVIVSGSVDPSDLTSHPYSLVVTKTADPDADQEIEPNDKGGNTLPASGTVTGEVGLENPVAGPGRLFGFDYNRNQIVEIDPDTGVILKAFNSPELSQTGAEGLAYDGSRLFFIDGFDSNTLFELNPDNGQVIREIPLNPLDIHQVDALAIVNGFVAAYDSSTRKVYFVNPDSGEVAVSWTIPIVVGSSSLHGMAGATSRNSLFFTSYDDASIYELNATTGELVRQLSSGTFNVLGLAFLGGQIYAGTAYGYIYVLDPDTGFVGYTVPTNTTLTALGGDDVSTVGYDRDVYYFTANSNSVVTISATATGFGSNDNLIPSLEVFDSQGNSVVRTGDGESSLQFTPAIFGQYRVRVAAVAGTSGTYRLHLSSNWISYQQRQPGVTEVTEIPIVTSGDLDLFKTSPDEVRIDFGGGIRLDQLNAGDLTVDGVAASSFRVIDGDTVAFRLGAPLEERALPYTLEVHGVVDLLGNTLQFHRELKFDTTPPRVTSDNVPQVVPAGTSGQIRIHLSEPVATQNLYSSVQLVGQRTGYNYFQIPQQTDPTTSELVIDYGALADDIYTLTLFSGDFLLEDLVGNDLDGDGDGIAGGNFVRQFNADTVDPNTGEQVATNLFASDFVAQAPLGSLIYATAPGAIVGAIGATDDSDTFDVSLDSGQFLTILLDSNAASSLQPVVHLFLNTTEITGAEVSTGQTLFHVTQSGTYHVVISGLADSTGFYTGRVILNAVAEVQSLPNDTSAGAQNIDASFIPLAGTAQRAAVLGQADILAGPSVDLAELNANGWQAWAENATAAVSDDNTVTISGAGSIKFVTDGGFDTYLRYPANSNAQWDLSEATFLDISMLAQDPSPFGFQNGSPWIRLYDANGNYFQYQFYSNGSAYDLLNAALGSWLSVEIPLDASSSEQNGWRRTSSSVSPDLSAISSLEIHSDTWDNGFTLWVDRVGFVSKTPDWYSFTLNDGESATIAAKSEGGNGTLKLYASDGVTLLAIGNSSTSVDQAITDFFDQTTDHGPTTYYVRVASDSNYSLVVTRNATFDIEPNDTSGSAQTLPGTGIAVGYVSLGTGTGVTAEIEPNNSLTSANSIASSFKSIGNNQYRATVTGSISTSTDLDFYRFFASPGDILSVAMNKSGSVGDALVHLRDSAGNEIASDDQGGGNNNALLFFNSFASAGEYYIVADHWAGDPTAFSYSLNATLTTSKPTDSADYYQVSANAGDVLHIEIRTPGSDGSAFVNQLNPDIQLVNSSGVIVAPSATSNGSGYKDSVYTLTSSGTYTVKVSSLGGTSGEYVLQVTGATGALPSFTATALGFPSSVSTAPTQLTLRLSDEVLLTSVDFVNLTDLLIDGSPTATSVSVVDGKTLVFALPPTSVGGHTLTIGSGALQSVRGQLLQPFNFTFDIAAPITLPTTLTDGEGFLWDISQKGSIVDGGNADAYDGGLVLSGFNTVSTAFAEDSGREVIIGPQQNSLYTITRKIFIPDDQGFARYLEVVTNTSNSQIGVPITVSSNLGSDSATALIMTSSGDGGSATNFTNADNWLVTDDGAANGTGDPTMLHVIAGPNAQRPTSATLVNDAISFSYNLVLQPGETKIVMHFASQNNDQAAALSKAPQLQALQLDALAGMSPQELAQVVNFKISTPALLLSDKETRAPSVDLPTGSSSDFATYSEFATGTQPRAQAILAVASAQTVLLGAAPSTPDVLIFLQDASGAFAASNPIRVSAQMVDITKLVANDFDGDEKSELGIVSVASDHVTVRTIDFGGDSSDPRVGIKEITSNIPLSQPLPGDVVLPYQLVLEDRGTPQKIMLPVLGATQIAASFDPSSPIASANYDPADNSLTVKPRPDASGVAIIKLTDGDDSSKDLGQFVLIVLADADAPLLDNVPAVVTSPPAGTIVVQFQGGLSDIDQSEALTLTASGAAATFQNIAHSTIDTDGDGNPDSDSDTYSLSISSPPPSRDFSIDVVATSNEKSVPNSTRETLRTIRFDADDTQENAPQVSVTTPSLTGFLTPGDKDMFQLTGLNEGDVVSLSATSDAFTPELRFYSSAGPLPHDADAFQAGSFKIPVTGTPVKYFVEISAPQDSLLTGEYEITIANAPAKPYQAEPVIVPFVNNGTVFDAVPNVDYQLRFEGTKVLNLVASAAGLKIFTKGSDVAFATSAAGTPLPVAITDGGTYFVRVDAPSSINISSVLATTSGSAANLSLNVPIDLDASKDGGWFKVDLEAGSNISIDKVDGIAFYIAKIQNSASDAEKIAATTFYNPELVGSHYLISAEQQSTLYINIPAGAVHVARADSFPIGQASVQSDDSNKKDNIVVGDFDKDGKADVAVANTSTGTVSIWFGTGDGTFERETEYPLVEASAGGADQIKAPFALAAGNFIDAGTNSNALNGDFLATANFLSDDVTILQPKNPSIQLTLDLPVTGVPHGPVAIQVGDFNGDQKTDIAVANALSRDVAIWLGDGQGGFVYFTSVPVGASGEQPTSLVVGKFNGDDIVDLATTNAGKGSTTGSVSIIFGNAGGKFPLEYRVSIEDGAPQAIYLNNRTGDPLHNFIVFTSTNQLYWVEGEAGRFKDPVTVPLIVSDKDILADYIPLALADLTSLSGLTNRTGGDGINDLILVSRNHVGDVYTIRTLVGTWVPGTPTFQFVEGKTSTIRLSTSDNSGLNARAASADSGQFSVVFAYLNHDNKFDQLTSNPVEFLDLIVLDSAGQVIRPLINVGDGSFRTFGTPAENSVPLPATSLPSQLEFPRLTFAQPLPVRLTESPPVTLAGGQFVSGGGSAGGSGEIPADDVKQDIKFDESPPDTQLESVGTVAVDVIKVDATAFLPPDAPFNDSTLAEPAKLATTNPAQNPSLVRAERAASDQVSGHADGQIREVMLGHAFSTSDDWTSHTGWFAAAAGALVAPLLYFVTKMRIAARRKRM